MSCDLKEFQKQSTGYLGTLKRGSIARKKDGKREVGDQITEIYDLTSH